MTISFACPECRVQIEVADEYAGQSGQCPRCQQVIAVPSAKQPKPILTAAAVPVPPSDPWEEPREERKPRPRSAEPDEVPRRPRRARPKDSKPIGGPIWAWVLGIFAALVAAGLLFSSFAVLVFWRHPDVTRPPGDPKFFGKPNPIQKGPIGKGVTVGELHGKRIELDNGVFQLKSELRIEDPPDRDFPQSRAKVYDITLIANIDYVIEVDSNDFDSEVRIQKGDVRLVIEHGDRGGRSARILYRPAMTDLYFIHVTSDNQGLGRFTLTVREANQPKPLVPR